MTPRELFELTEQQGLADAQLRICDGMAVSFYPEIANLHTARYEIAIDVSDLQPIEYDELDAWRYETRNG